MIPGTHEADQRVKGILVIMGQSAAQGIGSTVSLASKVILMLHYNPGLNLSQTQLKQQFLIGYQPCTRGIDYTIPYQLH